MSNQLANPSDLIPFGQAGLPAFLNNAETKSSLDEQSFGGSVDRITQRDGSISMDIGGVKSNPMMSIDVVVLDAAPKGRDTYRAYYDGAFREDEVAPPVCYSADGKVPSPNAKAPQCASCADCPKNVDGSGANGTGKACSFFKHVAVAVYPDLDRIFRIKVSARSLFSKDHNGVPSVLGGVTFGFNNYGKLLQKMGTPWEAVVAQVSLPKGQTHGFFFKPVGYLDEAQFRRVQELKTDVHTMDDVLTVELAGTNAAQDSTPALPPAQPAQPAQALTGRAKWLADTTLPQNVRDWIALVDDTTAADYLSANYPNSL